MLASMPRLCGLGLLFHNLEEPIQLGFVQQCVIFVPTLVPGSGTFQLSRLAGLGYGLGLGFWVVITIIVSLTLTLTLITTVTGILP